MSVLYAVPKSLIDQLIANKQHALTQQLLSPEPIIYYYPDPNLWDDLIYLQK